jgi:hypothetical protein
VTNERLSPARACCVPAPDRSGRTCDKPRGHDGPHWTYGGNTLTWPRESGLSNRAGEVLSSESVASFLHLRAEMEQWLAGEGPHADQPAPVHLWADQLAKLGGTS